MNRTTLIVVVILLVVVLGIAAFASRNGDTVTNTSDTNNTVSNTTDNHDMDDMATSTGQATSSATGSTGTGAGVGVDAGASVTAGAVKSFTVDSSNFKFSPTGITVKKGDRVRITLNNVSGFHDLVIDEYKVATKRINGAGTDTIEFVADKSGTFEYYCSVGNHRAMGMKGTLTVQ